MTDAAGFSPDDDAPIFVISVAATLAGMHAQTLRQYDRLGLVSPSRTRGGGRRYSGRDVALLREVQRLSQEEGVSLAGIQRIMDLENQVTALRARVVELSDELEQDTADRRGPYPLTGLRSRSHRRRHRGPGRPASAHGRPAGAGRLAPLVALIPGHVQRGCPAPWLPTETAYSCL